MDGQQRQAIDVIQNAGSTRRRVGDMVAKSSSGLVGVVGA
jgi:hypothetical protein